MLMSNLHSYSFSAHFQPRMLLLPTLLRCNDTEVIVFPIFTFTESIFTRIRFTASRNAESNPSKAICLSFGSSSCHPMLKWKESEGLSSRLEIAESGLIGSALAALIPLLPCLACLYKVGSFCCSQILLQQLSITLSSSCFWVLRTRNHRLCSLFFAHRRSPKLTSNECTYTLSGYHSCHVELYTDQ